MFICVLKNNVLQVGVWKVHYIILLLDLLILVELNLLGLLFGFGTFFGLLLLQRITLLAFFINFSDVLSLYNWFVICFLYFLVVETLICSNLSDQIWGICELL